MTTMMGLVKMFRIKKPGKKKPNTRWVRNPSVKVVIIQGGG